MPSIHQLKPAFQNILRPTVNFLDKIGASPNQVTIFTLGASGAAGSWIYFSDASNIALLILPLFLFFRMAFNAIDGMLAREFNKQTPSGAILNEISDVLSDTFLYLPFVVIHGINQQLIIMIVILGIISEMAGVVALLIGAKRRFDGPMGKSDRAFIFGLIALLIGCGVPTGTWLMILLISVNILLLITIINRSRKAIKEIDDISPQIG